MGIFIEICDRKVMDGYFNEEGTDDSRGNLSLMLKKRFPFV
jgi:hypothetical protein